MSIYQDTRPSGGSYSFRQPHRRAHLSVVKSGSLSRLTGMGSAGLTIVHAEHQITLPKAQLLTDFLESVEFVVADNDQVATDYQLLVDVLTLVNALIFDDAPTPQVSAGPRGGVAVEWLVAGQLLSVNFIPGAEINMWADDQEGNELFDFNFNANWSQSDEAILRAKALLRVMSTQVERRVGASNMP